jgi:hypothetical protein
MTMELRALGVALLALTLADPSDAKADDRRLRFGVLGGASSTSIAITPETIFGTSGATSGHGGVLLSLNASAPISFEARLLWERRSVELSEGDTTGRARVDYVGIPLLIRVGLDRARVRPALVAGPELLIKTGARLAGTVDGVRIEHENFEDQVRGTDVALDVGAGAEIAVGRASLILEALYSHGLRNVAVPQNGGTVEVARTRAFRLSGGIRF